MLHTILTGALALGAATGQISDAPDRLITPHGVELSSDGRVFVLFAALNALGYSDESERKGPPLRAPVYHPVRGSVREAMRKVEEAKLGELRRFFDANPATIEAYLAALLAHDLGLDKTVDDLPASAKNLSGVVPLVKKLGADPALTKIFDDVAAEQRKHALELMGKLDKAFNAAGSQLGGGGVRAPGRLVIVPNPLDSHGAVRTVELKNTTYLVVGPGLETATKAALQASLRPLSKAWVSKSYANAAKLKKHWDGLKILKSITTRYPDGESYAAETLTRVITFRALASANGQNASAMEEDFVERETKNGLRWTRAIVQALDARGGEPMETGVAKILAKANP